jgi:regulator of RNase E activity RraA
MAQSIIERFRKFDSCVVGDALDAHGINGVVTGVAPVHPEYTAVGRAHTLSLERAVPEGELAEETTNFPNAMLSALHADRVLVVDGVHGVSHWGGNASRLAAEAGMAGVVIDGNYRDVPDVRATNFPVFGRGPTPRSGQRRLRVADSGSTVTVGHCTVETGDIVVADATGVAVVSADCAVEIADTADTILSEELLIERKIDTGATAQGLIDDDHEF